LVQDIYKKISNFSGF